jgi:hypothetical protein
MTSWLDLLASWPLWWPADHLTSWLDLVAIGRPVMPEPDLGQWQVFLLSMRRALAEWGCVRRALQKLFSEAVTRWSRIKVILR